ncbi:MAG: aldo/keto reductase [Betaproteobacteria bacterium]|nr:aldo/keto reductase [Betaproteobacteria bacterium]
MQYRRLGKTGFEVSEIGLGTWHIGGRWKDPFSNANAELILNRAIDAGVNFIATADFYAGGASEAAVGRVARARSERIFVATKCGSQIPSHVNVGYAVERLRGAVETSLKNTGLDALDLFQLDSPPAEVYSWPEIFELFDKLKQEGKVLNLGVCVEKTEDALKAIEYPNVATVQIIFNLFRQRPADLFFELANARDVGVIARVPLARGLLADVYSHTTQSGPEDHPSSNHPGLAFDKFTGLDYATGLAVMEELKRVFPHNTPLAQWALRWTLMFTTVSCVIPGASRPDLLDANLAAASIRSLTPDEMDGVYAIYEKYIGPSVDRLF